MEGVKDDLAAQARRHEAQVGDLCRQVEALSDALESRTAQLTKRDPPPSSTFARWFREELFGSGGKK
jgi:hypothetical protein